MGQERRAQILGDIIRSAIKYGKGLKVVVGRGKNQAGPDASVQLPADPFLTQEQNERVSAGLEQDPEWD